MQLVSYRFASHGRGSIAGVIDGDAILNAGQLLSFGQSISMLRLLESGPDGLQRLRAAVETFREAHRAAIMLPAEVAAPRWLVELDAPLPRPRTFRDFYAYESHVSSAYQHRNRPVPPVWYEMPIFFYQHRGMQS